MFDIFNIRFGATIVGPAGTGKSSIYRILAALMNNLREKGSPNPLFQKVKFQRKLSFGYLLRLQVEAAFGR